MTKSRPDVVSYAIPLDDIDLIVYSLSKGDLFYKTTVENCFLDETLMYYYLNRVDKLNELYEAIETLRRSY